MIVGYLISSIYEKNHLVSFAESETSDCQVFQAIFHESLCFTMLKKQHFSIN